MHVLISQYYHSIHIASSPVPFPFFNISACNIENGNGTGDEAAGSLCFQTHEGGPRDEASRHRQVIVTKHT